MSLRSIIQKNLRSLIIWVLLCSGLYLTSLYSYILFHIVAESFSIVIAFSLFMIAWNTRHIATNNYFLFLSIALMFAGLIDFVHTLAYKGMGIFQGFDANLPTQLWIIARYLQSLSLLMALWFIDHKLNIRAILGLYFSATLLLLAAVFFGALFPDCFVEGHGLTPFKIASEYVICLILFISLALLLCYRDKFDRRVLRLMVWSILFTIVSELAFTFYISVYGLSNLIGHYFKIFSFYLVYRAIIVTGLENPYRLLFYDIQKNSEELQTILDASPVMIFYKDRENKFIRVNEALAEATGLSKEEIEGKTVFEIYPNQGASVWKDDKEVIASRKPKTGIIEPIETAISTRWVQTDKIPYKDIDGRIIGIIGFSVDITDRKKIEEALRKSEEKYRLVVENATESILIAQDGLLKYVNPMTVKLLGYSEEVLTSMPFVKLIHPEDMEKLFKAHIRIMKGEEHQPVNQFRIVTSDGTVRWADSRAVVISWEGKPATLNFFTDITELKTAEQALKESEQRYRELSIVDDLTQLYNSRQFFLQLRMESDRSNRYNQPLTLLFLDLDNFKAFNDSYGHVEGDKVLQQLGRAVKRCLRKTDSAYRYGGEEFTVLLPMTTIADGVVTAERIRTAFKKETFSPMPGRDIHMTVSIGLAQYRAEEEMMDFVQRTDQLMYQAKKNGKDRVCSEP